MKFTNRVYTELERGILSEVAKKCGFRDGTGTFDNCFSKNWDEKWMIVDTEDLTYGGNASDYGYKQVTFREMLNIILNITREVSLSNKEYPKATVDMINSRVAVGCQTFTFADVEALYKATRKETV